MFQLSEEMSMVSGGDISEDVEEAGNPLDDNGNTSFGGEDWSVVVLGKSFEGSKDRCLVVLDRYVVGWDDWSLFVLCRFFAKLTCTLDDDTASTELVELSENISLTNCQEHYYAEGLGLTLPLMLLKYQ